MGHGEGAFAHPNGRSTLELRPYQRAAVDATYGWLRGNEGDPVVVCPTGAGKGVLIAQFAHDVATVWSGRLLCLVHTGELVRQNHAALRRHFPDVDAGVYSAGLRSRDANNAVVVASVQSVYERAAELGPFDVILIDEAHRVGDDDGSMYQRLLRDARIVRPSVRTVGLTATPFRLQGGPIHGPDRMFDAVCYEIGVRELITDGWLCRLVTRAGSAKVDTSGLHVRGGDYVADEVERLVNVDDVVVAAVDEIVELTRDRHSVLIFTAGVEHGRHVERVFAERHDLECAFVEGNTPVPERNEVYARFRGESDGLFERPPLKFLASCQLLTEGFDAPNTDAVVLLRPTASPGLYCQMVGRGLRVHPSKTSALILDFGGNIERHGPIDLIRAPGEKAKNTSEAPGKECPGCHAVIAAGYAACPECGHEFPPPERTEHEAQASKEGILSGEVIDTEYEVRDVFYHEHRKKGAPDDAPRTLRVDYQLGLDHFVSEWVCFEHRGWARRKAEQWWRKRSPDPPPDTAREAVDLCEARAVAIPNRITVRTVVGEPFDRIVACELGPMPEPSPAWGEIDLSEVPF